ncbi:hypothetical protein BKA70DRAFT_1423663 [Coprinopsis sp. MPI-PUGE-AT-0042]|nr:hypothetical protein BKA70DRAFT_1423663 [Coprinopsis sp. MPI-PUGE-AT-0042]
MRPTRVTDYAHLDADRVEHYEGFYEAFEEEHGRIVTFSDSEESDSDEDSEGGGMEVRAPDEYCEKEYTPGAYFEGYCGRIFPEIPQLRATFATHAFQRLLNEERRAIRAEKRRRLAVLRSTPGRFFRVDDVKRSGLTFEEIYGDALDTDDDSD